MSCVVNETKKKRDDDNGNKRFMYVTKKKRKQPFRDVNFRDGCDHLFNVHLSFQEMRWVGGLPLISQVP